MTDAIDALLQPPVLAALAAAGGAVIGGTLTVVFGPKVQWNIEQRRERLKARREFVTQWRAMVAEVAQEEAKPRAVGDFRTALDWLERHQSYASLQSAYARYELAGLRGIKTRCDRSRIARWLRKPQLSSTPERTVLAGTSLSARVHVTKHQIAAVAKWWGID